MILKTNSKWDLMLSDSSLKIKGHSHLSVAWHILLNMKSDACDTFWTSSHAVYCFSQVPAALGLAIKQLGKLFLKVVYRNTFLNALIYWLIPTIHCRKGQQ